jgi:hypothetical protein
MTNPRAGAEPVTPALPSGADPVGRTVGSIPATGANTNENPDIIATNDLAACSANLS